MFFSSYHWNVVLSSIFHAVSSRFQIPLSPRSDDFHIWSQRFDGKFETNLVITFTSRTVSDRISTFFFSNIVGKQLTKAALTTLILTLCVKLLECYGITVIALGSISAGLILPPLLLVLIVWYLLYRFL